MRNRSLLCQTCCTLFTRLTILTHSVMLSSSWWCLVSCLIERMVLRRASYASNRDKLGSKNSLYQSTSSLHASEQVMTKSNKSPSPLSSSPSSPASPSSPWSCSSLSWWWWFQSSPSPAPSPSPTTPGPRHASPGGHRLPGHHAGHGHGHDDECPNNDDDAENSNNLITMMVIICWWQWWQWWWHWWLLGPRPLSASLHKKWSSSQDFRFPSM